MGKVLTAKLPAGLIADLGTVAETRGVSRNRLVREALEAMVEGRVTLLTEEERATRRLVDVRESLARDRRTLQAASAAGRATASSQLTPSKS